MKKPRTNTNPTLIHVPEAIRTQGTCFVCGDVGPHPYHDPALPTAPRDVCRDCLTAYLGADRLLNSMALPPQTQERKR